MTTFDVYVDIQKYVRKLNKKKKYMMYKPAGNSTLIRTNDYLHTTLKNKSLFNPTVSDNGHIEVFKKLVTQDIQKMEKRKKVKIF